MPIHNWAAVSDGMFHWFHQRWIGTMSDWLNQGHLPEHCYAIGETYAGHLLPDVLAVQEKPNGNGKSFAPPSGSAVAVQEAPPKTRFTWEAEIEAYLEKQNYLAVRSIDGILIAVVKVVSPGNKSSKVRFRKFLDKTIEFLNQGVHLLVVDLFPPTPRDPHGIHQVIWSECFDSEFTFEPDKPLTLASYRAGNQDNVPRCFVEPVAVGEALPPMPVFLWNDSYINLDLEKTYRDAWAVYPEPLKPKVEAG